MRIFDIHTHIIPGIDDGAQTVEKSLQMLECCMASDVTAVALTPHCNVTGVFENYLGPDLDEAVRSLRQAARALPVELYTGAEVRVNDRLIPMLQQGKLPTLGGSRYLLTEFPMDCPETGFTEPLGQILEAGYIPLIAHPERYSAVFRAPAIVGPWLDMGCHIQITGGSLSGSFGSRAQSAAEYLLHNDMVCCIASDAHGTSRRSNFLLDAYDHLTVRYSRRYAQSLMWENPMRICTDDIL